MRFWLRDLRLNNQMSQKDVANLASVDVTTINKIELGERRPSPETAKKIAAVLGFDWVKFFEDENELTKTGTDGEI